LEAYIGLPALLTMYGDSRGNQGLTDRISGDDPAIRALARALRIAHAIYKPDHITLLGGIGSRLGHVLPELQRLVSTNLTFVAKRTAQVSLASGDHYAAAGCAFIAARPVASVRVAQR
jgi:predicted NBD/HSP70 family sugar kinase